jgi:glycosyltransferase involved in cell wall biosynthesis
MKNSSTRSVAVVRGGEWNTTQAVPRVVSSLKDHLGYHVVVYSWTTSDGAPAEEVVDGTLIRRYTKKMPRAGVKYFAMWPLLWAWIARAIRDEGHDYLHVMNLDCVIPAVLSKPFLGHKVVYDIRDPWAMALVKVSLPLARVFRTLDRVFASKVDGMLICMGGMNYTARFYGGKAASSVPIIQVLNVPERDVGAADVRETDRGHDGLLVNYSGRLSALRSGHQLVDAVEGLDGVRLHVYGKLNDAVLRDRFEKCDKVDFEGVVPYDVALEYLRRADVTTLIYDPRPPSVRIGTSNKLFESLMLGKPYICTTGTMSAEIAEEHGVGWAVEYGNTDQLRELLAWLRDNPQELIEAGRRGRATYESHFRWELQRKNILDLYRHLAGDASIVPRAEQGWSKVIGKIFTRPLDAIDIDRFEI